MILMLYAFTGVSISSGGVFELSTCVGGNRIRHVTISTAVVTVFGRDAAGGSDDGTGVNTRCQNRSSVALSSSDDS